ncbi:MAG TPA: tyrosine-type recombinase/integrase [Candidatus Limnocylindrales bacterium]|nr:tyrosine-type recombinase/integrase [Candidatus Limnocylindrales bacterium]
MAKRREKGEGCLRQLKPGGTWYAQFYDPNTGKQVQRTTGTTIKQQAIGVLRNLMADRDKGLPVANPKLTYADLRRVLLASYLDRGNKSLRVNAEGEESIIGLPQLDTFCGYVAAKEGEPGSGNPGPQVARLTEDFVEAFKAKRREEGAGPAMINRSLQCLRRMLRLAHKQNRITRVPYIGLLKEPPARKGFLERGKFAELLGALPGYLRPLVTFLYWCGVRLGEAQQIQWGQVKLGGAQPCILLQEEQTKSGDARVVPLPAVLVNMLAPMQASPEVLVFDSTNLRTEWARACAAVGLGTLVERTSANGYPWQQYSGLKVHDLRRSAVRNLRLAGIPEGVAMKISGHKTRDVFDRYNIVDANDVAEAMRQVEVAAAKQPSATRRVSARLVQKPRRKRVKLLTA